MKKLFLFVIVLASLCLAAGGSTPSSSVEDGWFEIQTADSTKAIRFGSLTSGLDTLDGADSVQILKEFVPKLSQGWEYILKTNALSGDSASTTVLEVILIALDKNDSVMSHAVVDTFAAAGESVRFPFGETHAGIGSKFNVYLKSKNASSEAVIQKLWLYKRRIRQIQTIK